MRTPLLLPLLAALSLPLLAEAPAPAPPAILGFAVTGSTTLGSQYILSLIHISEPTRPY